MLQIQFMQELLAPLLVDENLHLQMLRQAIIAPQVQAAKEDQNETSTRRNLTCAAA